jgi:hypothetical protein
MTNQTLSDFEQVNESIYETRKEIVYNMIDACKTILESFSLEEFVRMSHDKFYSLINSALDNLTEPQAA